MLKRFTVTCINILFPPVAVYLLCGVGRDLLINSILFLLAVIPSHIHGFYLSWTYFNRKGRVARGAYPGGRKPMIYSSKVQRGEASGKEMETLKRVKTEETMLDRQNKQPGHVKRLLRRLVHRPRQQKENCNLAKEYEASEQSREERQNQQGRLSSEYSGNTPQQSLRMIQGPPVMRLIDNGEHAASTKTSKRNTMRELRQSLGKPSVRMANRPSSQPQENQFEPDANSEQPPTLPRRTYRSDIDGWLTGVRPGQAPSDSVR